MTAAAEATSVDEIGPVSDRPDWPIPKTKDQRLMVVEIDCRVMAQVVPNGIIVYQGVHRYRLQRYHLPVLMAQEMTDRDRAELARCEALHQSMLAAHINEYVGRLTGLEREQEEYKLRARYAGSPEALFTRDNGGRSIPPFNRVTVVQDELPPPVDEAAQTRAEETAKLVVAAVGAKPVSNGDDLSEAIATGVASAIETLISKGILSVNTPQGGQKKQ